jgi:ERCC4-related helicase
MIISKEVNQKIDINELIRNSEKAFTERLELLKNDSENCSKYDNISRIFSLISTEEKRKILIFTEYESTLNEKMAGILTAAGIKYGRLKGTSDTIKKVIDSYRNGDVNVLMINSVYFGSGTNLENTTDIIIIHKMPSDIEMQVIGRAQRFGRVGNLRIWKLYYQNEI